MSLSPINGLKKFNIVLVVYKHFVPPALRMTNFGLSLVPSARIPAAVPPSQCGKALPYRSVISIFLEAAPRIGRIASLNAIKNSFR